MGRNVALLQPWTDQALMQQMRVLENILQAPISHVDVKYMSNQCLLLSKILDSLVANNTRPVFRHELLRLIQQVCKFKNIPDARPALLVLLLSVKSAFRAEWLSQTQSKEKDDIFATLKSLYDAFTTGQDVAGQAPAQPLHCGGSALKDHHESGMYLNSISSRYYPRLQVNAIFVAVQSKVGYEVLMCDFHVPHMHMLDRVRLYVGQKYTTGTANCLVTPPQVNILINGLQVEKRFVTNYMDAGPQMPSDVTRLVKVGANVLQVIGEFSVPYVIAVASSRTIEWSSRNTQLEDYVAPSRAANDVDPTEIDDEVVEGASRVSLRCPISHQRLVTPVKAATCRHLQCFDLDSFLEINEKRPVWRCPCCNRSVSCPDLRIDRQMEKVLQETDEKIHEVIVSQDGSWMPVPTDEDPSNTGPDVIEGGEDGCKVIYLSDVGDEEVTGLGQNADEFQQRERKPDLQTLQAINENRVFSSQTFHPVVGRGDTVGYPTVNRSDITASSPMNSSSFAGPSWVAGANRNDGIFMNVNGGGLHTPISGAAERQVQSQPTPQAQTVPTMSLNIQATYSQSRTASHLNSPSGPVNRLSQSSVFMTTPLQQPQARAPWRGETASVRQRQAGQQSLGNSQDLGQTRQQQRRGPVTTAQQARGGPSGQRPSGSASPVQASPSETSWRPAGRMRGSIAPNSIGRSAINQSPSAAQARVSVAPSAGILNPAANAAPVANIGQYQIRMPTSSSSAINLPPYNGVPWANQSDLSMLTGVETSAGWMNFEPHSDSGAPHHSH